MYIQVDQTTLDNTVELLLLRPLNYEENEIRVLNVTVTDGTTTPITQILEITVLDQNEQPTDILINNLTIQENIPSGTIVSSIVVVDPDFTETFHCTLLYSSNGVFHIDGLSLVVVGSINYELQASHTIIVECSDKGELAYTKVFNITVLNVNDAPTGIESEIGFTINENMPTGTQIALLRTMDEDSTDSFTYHLNNHTDKFVVAGNVISSMVPLNFEEQYLYHIEIESTDSAGVSVTESHAITVVDVNDAPNDIFFVDAPIIPENAPINTMIGRLNVSDEDKDDSHTFAVVGRSDHVRVDEQGLVYTSEYLDFEQASELALDVVVTDNSSVKEIKSLTIFVTDVNEAPYRITLSNYKIAENQPVGTAVATIVVKDQDFNETFFCQLTQPFPFYFVTVNNSTHNALTTTNATINYELTPSYPITLDCYDHGGLVHRENISMAVVDKNDPPTQIIFADALYSTTTSDGQLVTTSTVQIFENTNVGQTVTEIVVVDEDANDSHTCTITNSTYSDGFNISFSGESLQTRRSLDFEEINRVYLEISCSDSVENITAYLWVDILNVNEPVSNVSLLPNVITENTPSGVLVGVFNFVDPDYVNNDINQSVYILTLTSTYVPFVISRNSSHWYLSVTNQQALNYEMTPSFILSILIEEISQEDHNSYVRNVEVFLQDMNESPTNLTLLGGYTDMSIPSNTHPGVVVGTFSVSDEDLNDNHTLEITGGTTGNYFEISGKYLILARQLTVGSYDLLLDVDVTDQGGLTALRHFVISVTDNPTCANTSSNPCHKNAICFMHHPDQESCVCELGYSGDGYSCVDIDYCESDSCDPNNTIGSCIDGQGGINNFICNCKAGYNPPNCSTEIDECAAMPCDPVGSTGCVDLLDDYNCTCQKGYTGKLCEVNINSCKNNLCMNSGTCIDQVEGFKCMCVAPYWGEYCEHTDTVCGANHPCPHGGECDILTNTCQCTTPYTENCQHCIEGCYVDTITGNCVDYDECANNPHPCGKNSTFTCVNLKSKPCSFCCLDENGDIQFCGPEEIDNHSENLELQQSEDTPVIAIVIPTVLIGIAIIIVVVFGMAYFKYHNVSRKYKISEGPNGIHDTSGLSFHNPTYNSSFTGQHQSDKEVFKPMPYYEDESSVATTAMSGNDSD